MRAKYSRRLFLTTAAGLSAVAAARAHSKAKFDVQRFIEDVRAARGETDSQQAVEEVLRRAVSEPGGILAAIGQPAVAGIHPVYQAKDLTILNVVWAPLMVLLPHNHGMWASIGVYTGREDNILWQRNGAAIEANSAASLSEGEVFSLPHEAIHSVTNPIGRLTGAIHIYGADFFGVPRSEWDSETLRERPFDLEAARRSFREASDRFNAGR